MGSSSSHPVSPEDEHRYRCSFLRRDARTLAVLVGLGLVVNLFLIRSDILFLHGQSLFAWVLALRLIFTALSLLTLIVIQRTDSPRQLDRWAFAWALACVLLDVLINLSRPATYIGHVILDLCVVLGLYALQPGPVWWRVSPPIGLSAWNLWALAAIKKSMDDTTTVTVIAAYLVVNATGWLFSANWHHFRWFGFFAGRNLERLCRESEQRRLAAEEAERHWERIIDTAPSMIAVIDAQYRIQRVNKTFVDRFGISKQEAIGRSCCELVCGFDQPPDQPPLVCPHRTICATPETCALETFFPSIGCEVRIAAAPLMDHAGNWTATVVIIQDISEWKQTEQALKTTREQYRSLVENCHGIIYTITPDGYVTYASPSIHTLLGFSPEHFVGKHFSEMVYPDDLLLCEAFQQEVLRTGEIRQGLEYRILHQDGSLRWHLSNFIPRQDAQGQVRSYVGNAVDITEQKQHQAELTIARKEADAANKAKSDFLALVSHEIRTPLNAIVGFSGLVQRTTDPGQLRTYVDIIDQSAHLLMDLVNDVLDMSRVEAGRLIMEEISFNLPELLELLQWQFAPIVAKKPAVAFSLRMDGSLPDWIVGDPTRLRQIVSNLLGNALKFTESGSVVLRVWATSADEWAEGRGRLHLAVQDTGIGIDASKQALLFQPFQQIDPGITRKYGGTGLGLAIVRRLVELMGGTIEVSSRLGAGSCFSVELPCILGEPCPYQQVPVDPALPLAVLVVEDDVFNRFLLQETLCRWGHRVSLVNNALEAMELLEVHCYDGIILDVWMPEVDGLALASHLRSLERLSQRPFTPILAYTADTDERIRVRCQAVGIQEVLFKPLDSRKLAQAMAAHCRPSQSRSVRTEAPEKAPTLCWLSQRVVEEMGPDPERLATYAHLLLGDIDNAMNQLDQALLRQDRRLILDTSHGLKGLCSYLHNQRAGELALLLHKGAMDLPLPELEELASQLRVVCGRPLS